MMPKALVVLEFLEWERERRPERDQSEAGGGFLRNMGVGLEKGRIGGGNKAREQQKEVVEEGVWANGPRRAGSLGVLIYLDGLD
jgi:hypothetical protein